MKNDKSKNVIIALLIIIIIILGASVVLFATNTISLNINSNSNNSKLDNNEIINDNNEDNNKIVSRDDILIKMKESLTNQEWIKEHLYSKEDCFGQKVESINQKLTFAMLSDEKNNPIVIVLNYTSESFINVVYKVYYENDNILVQNITNSIAHPSHTGFTIDKEQGLVIESYMHMGYYTFKAYDVKSNEIKIYDEYNCETGNCDYEYKGEKDYNISNVDLELNNNNIENYLK